MPIYHDQKLIFIHIPKTAGTSIRNLLDNTFGKADIIEADGHDLLKDVYRPDYKVLCVIRNPIKRVRSFYDWFRTNRDYSNYPFKELALKYTYDEWINKWWLPEAKEQSKYILVDNKLPDNVTIIKHEHLISGLNNFFAGKIDIGKLSHMYKTGRKNPYGCKGHTIDLIRKKEHWLYENKYYL